MAATFDWGRAPPGAEKSFPGPYLDVLPPKFTSQTTKQVGDDWR